MSDNKPLIPGFDLNDLRLPQNFGDALGVKRFITRVPVRKPLKTEFLRVRTGEAWRFQTMILELKEEGCCRRRGIEPFSRCLPVLH